MLPKKVLKLIIILIAITNACFIQCCVKCEVNNIWGQLLKGLHFDRRTIRTINVKLKEAKITLTCIFLNTF